jgi:aryl-alcohol dehydrogenase-like predicted oxidoreductase
MRLLLGTWQFSGDSYGPYDDFNVNEVLNRFEAAGGVVVETASSYGMNRESENRIANYIKNNNNSKIRVITKIGNLPHTGLHMPQCWQNDFLEKEFFIAKGTFGKHLEAVLLHSPPCDPINLTSALQCINKLTKDSGHRFGVALRSTSDLSDRNYVEVLKKFNVEIITLNFSLLDQRLTDYFKVIKNIKNNSELSVIVRTVLNFGFLANPNIKINSINDHRLSWSPQQIDLWRCGARKFEALANSYGMTLLELALRFPLSFETISDVCVGFLSEIELNEAASFIQKGNLDDDLVKNCIQIYKENSFFIKHK